MTPMRCTATFHTADGRDLVFSDGDRYTLPEGVQVEYRVTGGVTRWLLTVKGAGGVDRGSVILAGESKASALQTLDYLFRCIGQEANRAAWEAEEEIRNRKYRGGQE